MLRFGLPLALGMFFQNFFNLADAYLVSYVPKEELSAAVGAMGIVDPIAAIGTIVSFGISSGTGVLLSKAKGRGDDAEVKVVAWQSLLIVLALSIFVGVFGALFSEQIISGLVGAKGDVAKVGARYLRVMLAGSFGIFFILQITSIQRALGSAKTPVALLVLGNAINVVTAAVFVLGDGPMPPPFGFLAPVARALSISRMGLQGAAWATLLARSIVLVPLALLLVRRFDIRVPKRGSRGPDLAVMKKIWTIAWPQSAQFVVRIAAMLLVSSLAARFFTTAHDQTASVAMGLVFRVDTLTTFVAMGWGNAAQTFVGQNLGAKNPSRAKKAGAYVALYDFLTNAILVWLLLAFGEKLLRVLDADPAPLAIATAYLRVVAPSYLALGVGITLGNAIAGAGATRTTLEADLAVICGVQAPLAIALVAFFHFPIHALYASVATANCASAVVYFIVYTRGRWLRTDDAPASA